MSTEDQLGEAQAWAAWFAAKSRWLSNNQIGRVKKSNKKLRAESVTLRNQQSQMMSERDKARAAVDRVWKLVTDAQTVGWAGIPVMHGGKPFPVMVSVDAVIEALDGEARA